jgi:hypothetical protein
MVGFRIRTQIDDFQGFVGCVMCVERPQIINMYSKTMLEEIVKLKNECGFSSYPCLVKYSLRPKMIVCDSNFGEMKAR